MEKVYPSLIIESTKISYFLKQIPEGSRVLEFGPAVGYMTRFMQERGCRVTCIELNPDMAKIASTYAEKMIIANIDMDAWDSQLEGTFDYILFGDVLEHLRNPEATLQKAIKFLSPQGHIISSIPNISHNAILLALKKGKFKYTEYGLLDNSHIHFFTRESMNRLFENLGLKCVEENSVTRRPGDTEVKVCYFTQPLLSLMLFHRKDGHTYQFVCKWGFSKNYPGKVKLHFNKRYPIYKFPLLLYYDIKDFICHKYNIHFHILPTKNKHGQKFIS